MVLAAGAALTALADAPAGYYSAMEGKKQADLKQAAKTAAYKHTRISYGNSTWEAFEQTDTRIVNGQEVWWDMYSDNLVRVQSGHGGLNIEHSVANSWWGKTKNDAYCDLFHLNPSDSEANNRKSNYPLGIVNTVTYTNGVTTVGKPASGTCGGATYVYEPADCYKGDFARAFFYIFTIYDDINWSTSQDDRNFMFDGKAYPSLKSWATELLLEWSKADPVDAKEIARNEAIYKIQGNRNPFIDYPDLADYIWGARQNTAFTLAGDHSWPSGSTTDPEPDPDPIPDQTLAAPVTLPAAEAYAFVGTHYDEVPKSEESVGQAERWQPLEECMIDDYTFSFTSGTGTQTAWYDVLSTATTGEPTLRFYNGSTMTVTAPEGKELGKIVLHGSNANASLKVTSDRGVVTRDENDVTWIGLATGEVTFSFNATYRVADMEVYTIAPAGVNEVYDAVYNATAWSPASGQLTVSAHGTPVKYAYVHDLSGRVVASGSLSDDLNLSLASGVYVVSFSDGQRACKVIVR